MSNIASTAMSQHSVSTPKAGPMGAREKAFSSGTLNLLNEARNVVENATQQGQELNPMIYQMLGMEPTYEDHSAELQSAQAEFDAAQKQWDETKTTISQLKAIPKAKRTPAQRKQLKQLGKQLTTLQTSLEQARDAHGALATMPKRITGFSRMEPENIPANSPFSAQNPLYSIQRTEAERAQQALAGGIAVDPTLVHQYDQAESQLRAQLATRYGPDYENSSVGQMALQNFMRQKNEAYATWNYNTAQQYASAAFNQAGAQQSLLSNLIGMYREPGTYEANMGAQLSNLAGQRISQQQAELNERMARAGMSTTVQQTSPMGMLGAAVGGIGSLLNTPYQTTDAQGRPTTSTLASSGASWIGKGVSNLFGGGAGAGGATAADAAAVDAGYGGAAAADAGYTMAAGEGATGAASLL